MDFSIADEVRVNWDDKADSLLYVLEAEKEGVDPNSCLTSFDT